MVVSDPPTQGEVQAIADKLDELINGLRRLADDFPGRITGVSWDRRGRSRRGTGQDRIWLKRVLVRVEETASMNPLDRDRYDRQESQSLRERKSAEAAAAPSSF